MSIINIRGTSGSGKSTIARMVMEHPSYGPREAHYIEGRKRPLYYTLAGQRPLAVLGHYETACGGCDTIPKMDTIFQLARELHDSGHDVLMEGLLMAADVQRHAALAQEGYPLLVVALDEPLDVCLASVNNRRHARNPDLPPVNPKNTTSKHRGVMLSVGRLKDAGVRVVVSDREGALSRVLTELEL